MIDQQLITEAELAQRLQLPRSTIADLRQREGWPHQRFGRLVRYTPEDAAQIIAAHHIKQRDRLPGQTVASMNRKRRSA